MEQLQQRREQRLGYKVGGCGQLLMGVVNWPSGCGQ